MQLRQLEQTTTALPLVGYTVWWRLSGISVQHSDLEAALRAAQFENYIPESPTPRKALRRALTQWIDERATRGEGPARSSGDVEEDQPGSGRATRAIIRVINQRRSKFLVYALVAEDIDFKRLGLRYGVGLRILLSKPLPKERTNGVQPTLICTTEAEGVIAAEQEAHQITSEIRPHWQHYQHLHIAGDLSRTVRAIVDDMQATNLRREGGLYFVPAAQQATLERLRGLIEGLPTDRQHEPYLLALGVPDERESRRQLTRAVHAGFIDELNAARSELDRLLQSDSKMEPETVYAHIAAYAALKAKAQTYADLLGMQQEKIVQGVAELTERAHELLLGDADMENDDQIPAPRTKSHDSVRGVNGKHSPALNHEEME